MRIQRTRRALAPKTQPNVSSHENEPSAVERLGIKRFADVALTQAAKPSKAVDRNPVLGTALTATGSIARSIRALPNIVYPTIYGANGAEKATILKTLDSLPFHQASGVRSIRVVDQIPTSKENWVVHGRANDLDVSNRIRLSRSSLNTPEKMSRTLTHEVGHTVDYESQKLKLFGGRSTSEPFGEGPHVTEYAKTNNREDFAESYEEYFADPDNLKEQAPEKYEAVKEMAEPNFLERLVDREEFRETGKYMSEAFGESEASRHVAQGAYFAGAALQAVHGVSQWARSAESGDSLGHASGILNTATGLAFVSGISPLIGMGLQGANHALRSAVKGERLSAQEIESTVSLPVRPLEAIFGRKPAKIQDEHRPGKVAAVAAGGAVGGTVGSLVGPYVGVLGGYHLAGGLGGTIGLVAGGMLGFLGGAELGGRLGGKLAGL